MADFVQGTQIPDRDTGVADKVWYVVRFQLYHYNSGAADNGRFRHKKEFEGENALAEAITYSDLLQSWINAKINTGKYPSGHDDLINQHCYDGFLVKVYGVFRVKEAKVYKPFVEHPYKGVGPYQDQYDDED